jgi:heterodisulfide reductase subunit A-like polyferredoxin
MPFYRSHGLISVDPDIRIQFGICTQVCNFNAVQVN